MNRSTIVVIHWNESEKICGSYEVKVSQCARGSKIMPTILNSDL